MTSDKEGDEKKSNIIQQRNIDSELWKQVQEFAKSDTEKLKAVQIIFEKHYHLPEECIELIKKLSQKEQPKGIRIQIAKNLLQFDEIPFGMYGELVDILSNDPEKEVKEIVMKTQLFTINEKVKKESTLLAKSLNQLGISPSNSVIDAQTRLNRMLGHSQLEKISKLANATSVFNNPTLLRPSLADSLIGYTPRQPNYNIDKEKDLEKIVKTEEAIVLFEYLPLENLSSLNNYCVQNYGKKLFEIESRISRNVCQQSQGSVEITNFSSQYVTKWILHGAYIFGDYLQLILICLIKLDDFNKTNTGSVDEIAKKKIDKLKEIQIDIESKLPDVVHGFFFKNQLNSFTKSVTLPALWVFNTHDYVHFLEEQSGHLDLLGPVSPRDHADSFLRKFTLNPLDAEPENVLEKIGIRPILLTALIGKSIIVSFADEYFEHTLGKLYNRFVALHFTNNRINPLSDEDFVTFIHDLSLELFLESILTKIRLDLGAITFSTLKNFSTTEELTLEKQRFQTLSMKIAEVEEKFLLYKNAKQDGEQRHLLGFFKEETRKVRMMNASYDARSISDHFEEKFSNHIKMIESELSHKKKRIAELLEIINTDLQLVKDKPSINSLLKDIEPEIIPQIIKWKGKIEQKELEEWLLNFDNANDRKVALKILDKVSFVTYKDLRALSKSLYNRLVGNLTISVDKCIFSNIGKLTGGSAHILKIFQEENGLNEKQFIELDKLTNPSTKTPLILLDDFVGSGNTFCKLFKNDKTIQQIKTMNFEIHYAVLTAFDKGLSKIENDTKVMVLFGYLYESLNQIRDGNLFDEKTKIEITNLVSKYSNRLHRDYLWGYDDCQLLVSFEQNIPNNSISLLWHDKGWTPLIRRK